MNLQLLLMSVVYSITWQKARQLEPQKSSISTALFTTNIRPYSHHWRSESSYYCLSHTVKLAVCDM